jgi:hypothetical protein
MLLAAPALWAEPSIEEREADIFGAPAEEPDHAEEPDDADASEDADQSEDGGDDPDDPKADDSTQLGQGALIEQMERRLAERDEATLDIGGGLYSQLNYSVLDEGDVESFPLSQPNYLDVYLDARPNDRLRVFSEVRLTHTPTGTSEQLAPLSGQVEPTQFGLDQLWVKFDILEKLYVTAGKQHLRWGVGRFWYPNDFLYEQRRDPLAIFDTRTGVDMVRVHYPVESLGWNFYAVANLQGIDSPEEVGGAGRAEFLWGLAEFAFSAAAKKDSPLQLGFDVSSGLGWFDVRAAVSVLNGVDEPFLRGESNFEDFERIDRENVTELRLPEAYSREDDWIVRALGGAEIGIPYGDDDTFYVGAEYFFNDAGYTDPDLYPVLVFSGAFRPLYTGRHYASVYALLPSPGNWDDTSFSLATLGNLSDRSFMSRLDYSVSVLTHLRVFAFGSITWGESGEFTRSYRVPAISAEVIELARQSGEFDVPAEFDDGFDGLSYPATRANIGAGLRLSF